MKKISLLLFVTYSLFSCAQENKEVFEEFRIQGYLFVQTSMQNATSTNAKEMKLVIDNPKLNLFIPLKNMKSNFKESIDSFKKPTKDELYLPLGLTDSKQSIKATNFDLNRYIENNSINISPINEGESFKGKLNTIVKIENKLYYIVYIDGTWNRQKIPYKWTEVLSIGNYNSSSLNKESKKGYYYYFLNEINVISYDLTINEPNVEKI